jgi:hypothetical protein
MRSSFHPVEVATIIRTAGTAAVTAEEGLGAERFAGARNHAMVPVVLMGVGVAGSRTGSAAVEGVGTTTAAVEGVGMIPGLAVTEEEREEEEGEGEEGDRLLEAPQRRVRSPPPSHVRVTSPTCWRWLGRKQPGGHRLRRHPRRRRRRRRRRRTSLSFLPRAALQR